MPFKTILIEFNCDRVCSGLTGVKENKNHHQQQVKGKGKKRDF